MKILNVISHTDPAGGGPIEAVKQLGMAQVSAGHQVEIASLDSPDATYLAQCPLPIYPLGPATTGYSYSASANSLVVRQPQRIRCRRREWYLAVSQFRNLARLAKFRHSLCAVCSWHA